MAAPRVAALLFLLLLCAAGAAQADRARALRRFREAEAHYLAERYDEAMAALAAGYREDPDPEFVYNLAKVHQREDRPALALKSYQRYLEMAPQGRFRDKAQERVRLLMEAGADLLPEDPTPEAMSRAQALLHFRRAEGHYRAGRYTEAIGELGVGFERDSDPDFLYNIAKAQQKAGRLDRAVRGYQSYLALSPGGRYADKARAQLERLRPAQPQGELSQSQVQGPPRGPPPPPPRRPLWRLVLGAGVGGVGLGLLGAGAYGLGVNGGCVAAPAPPQLACEQIYATGAVGAGLTTSGVLLVLGGVALSAWPERRKEGSR